MHTAEADIMKLSPAKLRVILNLQADPSVPVVKDAYKRLWQGEDQVSYPVINALLDDGLVVYDKATQSYTLSTDGQEYKAPTGSQNNNVPKANNIPIYLGAHEVRERRVKALDAICEPFGGRSRMMQMIADGDLLVIVKQSKHS